MTNKLTPAERELVFVLASKLTNNYHTGEYRRDVLVNHVETRLQVTEAPSLAAYLKLAQADASEFGQLMSALTIHTTEWFRELPHFAAITDHVKTLYSSGRTRPLQVLSLGCSSGEEVYSFALALEKLRRLQPGFDYKFQGWDIDPVSIKKAAGAVYAQVALAQIPKAYLPLILLGSGPTKGLFTLDPEVRRRCTFEARNLFQVSQYQRTFDLIICRNVLIYFSPEQVKTLLSSFKRALVDDGVICLGHSEAVTAAAHDLVGQGRAIYRKTKPEASSAAQPSAATPSSQRQLGAAAPASTEPLVVLAVADVKAQPLLNVLKRNGFGVTVAASAEAAIKGLSLPALALIAVDMATPGIDTPALIQAIRRQGCHAPIVLIIDDGALSPEAEAALGDVASGIHDFIPRSAVSSSPSTVAAKLKELATGSRRVHGSSAHAKHDSKGIVVTQRPELIVLGASTGGTEALSKVLQAMPPQCPPVVVVQHITPAFSRPFAERLARTSQLKLGVPETGTTLKPGHLYMSFGDQHITVKKSGDTMMIFVPKDPLVSGHRPSVDVLFSGAAKCHAEVLALLLTGMGKDGAKGMKELRQAGALTLTQDEASCVVYGMPKEAMQLQAACGEGNLTQLRTAILSACEKPQKRKAG